MKSFLLFTIYYSLFTTGVKSSISRKADSLICEFKLELEILALEILTVLSKPFAVWKVTSVLLISASVSVVMLPKTMVTENWNTIINKAK